MEEYLLWFVKLDPFYRIVVGLAVVIAILALGTAAATDNPVFLVVGALWLLGVLAVARLSLRGDSKAESR